MTVPIRHQTAVGLRIEIPPASRDAGRFREELRDAETYPGWMLDPNCIDLEDIANALAGQTDHEHPW